MIDPTKKVGRFQAYLHDQAIGKPSRQPLVDGARALIKQGYPDNTLLTMRHRGAGYDSFKPMTIGTWAGISYSERDKDRLRINKHVPHPRGHAKIRPPA